MSIVVAPPPAPVEPAVTTSAALAPSADAIAAAFKLMDVPSTVPGHTASPPTVSTATAGPDRAHLDMPKLESLFPAWVYHAYPELHAAAVAFFADVKPELAVPVYNQSWYPGNLLYNEPTAWPPAEGFTQGQVNFFVLNRSRPGGRGKAEPIKDGHIFAVPGQVCSKEVVLADFECAAKRALFIRHAQAFVDGNHRTATLFLHVLLWQAGYNTGNMDPLQIYLLVAPEEQKPDAVDNLVKLIGKHTKRGEMPMDRQVLVAERVRSFPVVTSLLFFMHFYLEADKANKSPFYLDELVARVRPIKRSQDPKIKALYRNVLKLSVRV